MIRRKDPERPSSSCRTRRRLDRYGRWGGDEAISSTHDGPPEPNLRYVRGPAFRQSPPSTLAAAGATVPGLRRIEHVMGMPVVVDVRDDGGDEAVEELFSWLHRVDSTFSTYKDDSEVWRLGRGELSLADAAPDVREVLVRCESLRVETGGFFDAYAAGRLDPSGFVKGWAVDGGAAILIAAGLRNFAINAGGDIRLAGGALPAREWRVGIEHPLEHDRIAAVVAIRDAAVATSATYARGEHVLDPHTGRPPAGVLSVTITGPDLAIADAYATAAFAMGTAGPPWTARLHRYEALTILADRRVLSTAGFPRAVA